MSALPVDEGRRQAYLGALGIPLWSARAELPGALPAAPLDYVPWIVEAADGDGATVPDAGSRHAAAAGPGAAAGASPAPPAAPPAPGVPAGARPANPGPQPEAPGDGPLRRPAAGAAPTTPRATVIGTTPAATVADPAADARAPRLGCRAWTLAPGLSAVIDQGDAPDLSAAEHRLLANIALALDAPEPPGALGNLLRWPLNSNPRLDHGPAAMQAWLAHALRLPPGRCLVFGAALAAHVRAARPDLELIVAPALAELLAGGEAKGRLWRALHG